MAYQQSVITAITDIPPLVATFAAANGWTVTGTSATPILTRSGGGMSFQLTASIVGAEHSLTWAETGGSVANTNARITSPKLNGTISSPEVSIPSKVHLFAAATPEPYMVIVVEYGFNSYRHLYLGNMVKAGNYTGGEVISAAQPHASPNGYDYPMFYRTGQYLFNGNRIDTSIIPLANRGGVRVVHADNPTTWRRFYGPAWPYFNQNDASYVIGGFMDDVNDGYMVRGRSGFSGVQILSPINLYAAILSSSETVYAPIGYPAGIRHVNMTDLEPGAEFTIGSQVWKVFPAWSKGPTSVSKSASGWATAETSFNVGYAYPKS